MRAVYKDIVIRDALESDAKQLSVWWNDGSVMAHAGFPNGLGITEEKIAASLATDSDLTRRRLMIEYENRPIGEMNATNEGENVCQIGIKICEKAYQDRGLGRVILSMLINMLFDEYGYKKIVLDTNLNNTRAQHVYEKLGFIKTRVMIDSWTDQLGKKQSAVCYELTKDTFIPYL